MRTVADVVLIDTCIWVPFFSRKRSIHKSAVEQLLDDDRAAIIGPILAETLMGFKRDVEADWVVSALEGIHFVSLDWEDCKLASQLGRDVASRGHRLPLSDLTLAAAAQRFQCDVYSIDPHFDIFPNLKRYEPKRNR